MDLLILKQFYMEKFNLLIPDMLIRNMQYLHIHAFFVCVLVFLHWILIV